MCSSLFCAAILRLDWGIIWKILWECIFFLFCESVVSLLKFPQNMRLIPKRSIATICNFIHDWSHLLCSSAFNDKWKHSDLRRFLFKKKKEEFYYHFTFKSHFGASGWLGWLSIWLLVSAQGMISGSWGRAQRQALHSTWSRLGVSPSPTPVRVHSLTLSLSVKQITS